VDLSGLRAIRATASMHRLRCGLGKCAGDALEDQGCGEEQVENDSFHCHRELYKASDRAVDIPIAAGRVRAKLRSFRNSVSPSRKSC
jgi:hypothetical protein